MEWVLSFQTNCPQKHGVLVHSRGSMQTKFLLKTVRNDVDFVVNDTSFSFSPTITNYVDTKMKLS